MIYCFDTYYKGNSAHTAIIGIHNWSDSEPAIELTDTINGISEYESGSFYKRELPCLLSATQKISLDVSNDVLVVDGYVLLSDEGRLGLGGHLFQALDQQIPVVGVAKSDFVALNKKMEIYRGKSKNPLFVTALGIDPIYASEKIKAMHGPFRIPTILKLVDQKSRTLDT